MKQSRRDFISTGLTGLGGLLLTVNSLNASGMPKPQIFKKLGINVSLVNKSMNKDYSCTLQQLREMGYDFIESRSFGNSVEAYAKTVKQSGLRHLVTGYGLPSFTDDIDNLFKQADMLGAKYLVCYNPWPTPRKLLTEEIALRTSEIINDIGQKVKNAGFRFLWHNHGESFTPIGDSLIPFDIVMKNTDPLWSGVELDIYWAVKVGADPATFMKKYPGRAELLHIKDMDGTNEKGICCVGDGVINFKEIIASAWTTGSKHLIVEHEVEKPNEIDCARNSLISLRNTISEI